MRDAIGGAGLEPRPKGFEPQGGRYAAMERRYIRRDDRRRSRIR